MDSRERLKLARSSPSVVGESGGRIEFEVQSISVEDTYPLRRQILRPNIETLKFEDDFAESAMHLGAFVNEDLVGIISMFKDIGEIKAVGSPALHLPTPDGDVQWLIRGLAVAAGMQGKGLGTKLLTACEHRIKERRGCMLWCRARSSAQPFYVKKGFTLTGDASHLEGVGQLRHLFKYL